jgi:hypothetical protein
VETAYWHTPEGEKNTVELDQMRCLEVGTESNQEMIWNIVVKSSRMSITSVLNTGGVWMGKFEVGICKIRTRGLIEDFIVFFK